MRRPANAQANTAQAGPLYNRNNQCRNPADQCKKLSQENAPPSAACGQANDQKDGVVETGHTIGPILISNGLANAPSPPAQRCRAPLVWIGQTARRASCCADGEGRSSKRNIV